MKIFSYSKHLGMAALVLGFAVACATAPEEEVACESISAEVQSSLNEARILKMDADDVGADTSEIQALINEADEAGWDCRDEDALRLADEAKALARQAIAAAPADEEAEPAEEQDRSYTVRRGDSLWNISGSSRGYNDPYQWPLIYRANTDQIDDADLIYPGQRLRIEANPSVRDVDAAIRHARTRGEWELGVVEESDREYLRQHGN